MRMIVQVTIRPWTATDTSLFVGYPADVQPTPVECKTQMRSEASTRKAVTSGGEQNGEEGGREQPEKVFVLVSKGDGGDWAAAGNVGGPVHHHHDAAEERERTM
jgi:hypothetical protein